MLKKLFLIPWFGPFPVWMDQYRENIKHVEQAGYDWLITTDEDDFRHRAEQALGFTPNIVPGTSISHNYRTAFGLMYADKLEGYDFWGITDLDCVYGKVENFISDDELDELDIQSNHHNYICGPWTLFRNIPVINNLFREVPNWAELMNQRDSQPGRWTEVEYSAMVDRMHQEQKIKRTYTHYQGKDPNDTSHLSYKDGRLFDGDEEIMMFHFNRIKQYPVL